MEALQPFYPPNGASYPPNAASNDADPDTMNRYASEDPEAALLRAHIHNLLHDYAVQHLTTDYVAFTQDVVADVLSTLPQIPTHDPTALRLPAEPFDTLRRLHGLDLHHSSDSSNPYNSSKSYNAPPAVGQGSLNTAAAQGSSNAAAAQPSSNSAPPPRVGAGPASLKSLEPYEEKFQVAADVALYIRGMIKMVGGMGGGKAGGGQMVGGLRSERACYEEGAPFTPSYTPFAPLLSRAARKATPRMAHTALKLAASNKSNSGDNKSGSDNAKFTSANAKLTPDAKSTSATPKAASALRPGAGWSLSEFLQSAPISIGGVDVEDVSEHEVEVRVDEVLNLTWTLHAAQYTAVSALLKSTAALSRPGAGYRNPYLDPAHLCGAPTSVGGVSGSGGLGADEKFGVLNGDAPFVPIFARSRRPGHGLPGQEGGQEGKGEGKGKGRGEGKGKGKGEGKGKEMTSLADLPSKLPQLTNVEVSRGEDGGYGKGGGGRGGNKGGKGEGKGGDEKRGEGKEGAEGGKREDEDERATEAWGWSRGANMKVVDGWETYMTSSPSVLPTPTSSQEDQLQFDQYEKWVVPSSPDTDVTDVADTDVKDIGGATPPKARSLLKSGRNPKSSSNIELSGNPKSSSDSMRTPPQTKTKALTTKKLTTKTLKDSYAKMDLPAIPRRNRIGGAGLEAREGARASVMGEGKGKVGAGMGARSGASLKAFLLPLLPSRASTPVVPQSADMETNANPEGKAEDARGCGETGENGENEEIGETGEAAVTGISESMVGQPPSALGSGEFKGADEDGDDDAHGHGNKGEDKVKEDKAKLEDDLDADIGRVYGVRMQDPTEVIMKEKLDEKNELLMDVPLLPPPNVHPPNTLFLPVKLAQFVVPDKRPARPGLVRKPVIHGRQVFLKKARGIPSLTLELGWVPFKIHGKLPTHREVARVSSICDVPDVDTDDDIPDRLRSQVDALIGKLDAGTQPPEAGYMEHRVLEYICDASQAEGVTAHGEVDDLYRCNIILSREERRRLAGLTRGYEDGDGEGDGDGDEGVDEDEDEDDGSSDKENIPLDNELKHAHPDLELDLDLDLERPAKRPRLDPGYARGFVEDTFEDVDDSGVAFGRFGFEVGLDPAYEDGVDNAEVVEEEEPLFGRGYAVGLDGSPLGLPRGLAYREDEPQMDDASQFPLADDEDKENQFSMPFVEYEQGPRRHVDGVQYDYDNQDQSSEIFNNNQTMLTVTTDTPGYTNAHRGFEPLSFDSQQNVLMSASRLEVDHLVQDPYAQDEPIARARQEVNAMIPALPDSTSNQPAITINSVMENLSGLVSHALGIDDFAKLRARRIASDATKIAPGAPAPALPVKTADPAPSDQPRTIPEEIYDRNTLRLPSTWTLPQSTHRYMASLDVLQKQTLIRFLRSEECAVDFVERDHLAGVDVIFDAHTAAIYFNLMALPSQCEALTARISEQSWRYSRVIVILEAYSPSLSFKTDPRGAKSVYAYSPPVLKAIKKLRRDLDLAEAYEKKSTACSVQLAFANDVQETAMLTRYSGDLAESRDDTGGVIWGDRAWLDEEVPEDEDNLASADGMNRFAAYLILCQIPLTEFLDMSSEARLLQFGSHVGNDRMGSLNAVIERRFQEMMSSDFSMDHGSSID